MSLAPECLDNIIGLSRTTCECFDSGKPSDADVSKSELYLDELDGMNLKLADSINDCEEGSLWDILERSRRDAIKAFKSDLMASLLTKYKRKRNPFSGVIGSEKFKSALSLTNTYAGVRINCANVIGGVMVIKRIGLVFSSNDTFTIDVFDGIHDQSIHSFEVTSQAGVLSWHDLPLSLAMNYEAADESPDYYFVYQVNPANQPKDIKASCGCGGSRYKYYWDTKRPTYKTYEKDRWSEYIMLTGVKGDSTSDRENWSTGEHLNGIILDAEFKCKVNDLICKDELDFESNELALTMAYAVRFKAGQLVNDKILASPQVNIYTMTDRERLMGKKNTYVKEYLERISYLTENINYRSNDCLTCNDFDDLIKVGILS